jgi:GMP synthase (glutamine-hydrolysing)
VEVGTVEVALDDAAGDKLLGALPRRFPAQLSHRQSVLELPPGARALGHSTLEPHQAFAFGPRAWGVQFHPEFDARIIAHFVEYYRGILTKQGRSADDIIAAIQPAPESRWVLERFAALVRETEPRRPAEASEIPKEL